MYEFGSIIVRSQFYMIGAKIDEGTLFQTSRQNSQVKDEEKSRALATIWRLQESKFSWFIHSSTFQFQDEADSRGRFNLKVKLTQVLSRFVQ